MRFLSAAEAAAAIVDESMEPYFSILEPLEMVAKTGAPLQATDLAAQRDECRERYRSAVRDFTDEEKSAIRDVAGAATAALADAYPLFAETPWSFLKLDGSIEGGMPHTRGPHIVVPAELAMQFARSKAQWKDPAKSPLAGLLLHEQCHVLQRAHPALFADLYTKVWGLVHAKAIASHPVLAKSRVVNPDAPDMGWVFVAKDGGTTSYWQAMVLLPPDAARPRIPQDFRLVGVALERRGDAFEQRVGSNGAPVTAPLDAIRAFDRAFGRIPEHFHPNETFAVLFSWLAAEEHLGQKGTGLERLPRRDVASFRAWCRSHLGAPRDES